MGYHRKYPRNYAAAKALVARARNPIKGTLIDRNTRVRISSRGIAVQLHNTDVVTFFKDGRIAVNTGGWFTKTTKERINSCLLGIEIYGKCEPHRSYSDEWYVRIHHPDRDEVTCYLMEGHSFTVSAGRRHRPRDLTPLTLAAKRLAAHKAKEKARVKRYRERLNRYKKHLRIAVEGLTVLGQSHLIPRSDHDAAEISKLCARLTDAEQQRDRAYADYIELDRKRLCEKRYRVRVRKLYDRLLAENVRLLADLGCQRQSGAIKTYERVVELNAPPEERIPVTG